jgi:hypothetical protein
MSVFIRTTTILFFLSTPALACDIESCALPATLHQVEGETAPVNGVWTWLHHDLAVARAAATRNGAARALALAHSLDRILRSRMDDLVAFSGPQAVSDFHQALQRVVSHAGGWPLVALDLGGEEARG